MGTEEWLEEALVTANRLLRLVPSKVLKGCVDECRRQGVSLQTMATVSRQLGLVGIENLAAWQQAIPYPSLTLPKWPGVSVFKMDNKPSIENCRFLTHYLIGAVKETPVALDWKPGEKTATGLGRVIGGLLGQITGTEAEEEKNGNSDYHSA